MSASKKTKPHPLLWTVEPLQDEPSYLDRAWFGCRAVYLNGRMVLVLCSGEEPWNGLLIPTEKELHQHLIQDFSGVVRHPVLKKWLYLPENSEDFESLAMDLVEAVRQGDQRIGIEPKERKARKQKSGPLIIL